MPATPQTTPQFTSGGTVFARLAAAWNQYFAAKVDAEAGTADNLSITGTLTFNGATLIGISGVAAPLDLVGGTIGLNYSNQFGVNGSGILYLTGQAPASTKVTASFNVSSAFNTYFCDPTAGTIVATLPAFPSVNDTYAFKDFTGTAASGHLVTLNGNGNTIDGAATQTNFINSAYGYGKVQYNGTSWSIMAQGL